MAGAVLGVLECPGSRVAHQLGVILDGVADRIDAGGVAAGADDQADRFGGQVEVADRDVDRVGGAVGDDRVVLRGELRLQIGLRGGQVLTVDAGVDERVDHGLLSIIGLVHRGGGIWRDRFHRSVHGQRVGCALHLPGADDSDLPGIIEIRCHRRARLRIARGQRRRREAGGGKAQELGLGELGCPVCLRCDRHAWHPIASVTGSFVRQWDR